MLIKTETFAKDGVIVIAKMTARSICNKGTEDAGLFSAMLEIIVVVDHMENVIPPASRDYALDTIRLSFQNRPKDTTDWIVAGHAVPESMMVDILDWTYVTEWKWLNPNLDV